MATVEVASSWADLRIDNFTDKPGCSVFRRDTRNLLAADENDEERCA